MYHSIGRNNIFSTVSPEDFERQMNFLKKRDYNVIGLKDLVDILEQEREIPQKTIVLTFDDGYSDNFIFAWPVLKRCNFPASIFLTTGWVGSFCPKKNNEQIRMLDWLQIDKMAKSGLIDFQPHTINHPKLADITLEEVEKEIIGSQKTIAECLNSSPQLFAYPYGSYNQQVIALLKERGFRGAVTIKSGRVTIKDGLFEIRRKGVFSKTSIYQFKSLL